jgi:peptidyl-dipeptidase A
LLFGAEPDNGCAMRALRPFAPALFVLPIAVACGTSSPAPNAPTCRETPSSAKPSAPSASASARAPSVDEAIAWTKDVDAELRKVWTAQSRADWINQNFITDDTDRSSTVASDASMEVVTRLIEASTRFDGLALPADVARQIHLLRVSNSVISPSDAAKRAELAEITVKMNSDYGKAKYCPARLKGQCLELPDLEKIMSKSRKYDELLDAWKGWHETAKPQRARYSRFVELANEGAREAGFADNGALWKSSYDATPAEFEAESERLWAAVKPFYDELHCYVRSKLQKEYGKDRVPDGKPIPAHLLGNMWAQEWEDLYDLVEPVKGQPSIDVTTKIVAKKIDEKGMVRIGEGFFRSLGLDALPGTFWERSLFKKPRDREVVCHASAWDVGMSDDLRIKMCVEPTEADLLTIHHELGHDYYYHSYFQLPVLFQQGANDGFHEAVGDTIALSVTPGYYKSIGLLDRVPTDPGYDLNVQMKRALEKVAFLPFGKLIDQWRWDVFAGKIPPSKYDEAWWALRTKYQGVSPPLARTEEDFDPGAKYHVVSNTPYVRYFLASIYQFQFHRALCKAAGFTGPLHQCSIYGNAEAGKRLWSMLKLGASKPWPEALEALSGEKQADPSAMLEYFAPLRAWLKKQNQGQKCGW